MGRQAKQKKVRAQLLRQLERIDLLEYKALSGELVLWQERGSRIQERTQAAADAMNEFNSRVLTGKYKLVPGTDSFHLTTGVITRSSSEGSAECTESDSPVAEEAKVDGGNNTPVQLEESQRSLLMPNDGYTADTIARRLQ